MARHLTRALLATGLLSAVAPLRLPALFAQSLEKRLNKRLDTPPLDRTLWGVLVVDNNGKKRFGRNEGRLFTPASNTKLVVTAVASALLPADFRVFTSLYAAGPITNGVLEGDLVLYGRGDPTLGRRCYATDTLVEGACDRDPFARLRVLADTLRARGIREVRGDLVGDGSWFEPATIHPSWEFFDLNWWYAAPVSGSGIQRQQRGLHLAAGTQRRRAGPHHAVARHRRSALREPDDHRAGRLDLGHRRPVLPGAGHRPCLGGRAGRDGPAASHRIIRRDGPIALRRAGDASGAGRGGYRGRGRDPLDDRLDAVPPDPRRATTGDRVPSRPLKDWIFPILNTSQNLFAETLLKQLGRRFGKAGSWEEGIAVERRFLIDSVKIDSTEFSLQDGSGLSSANLVSPNAFARLLRFIRLHPGYPTFAAGLPMAGAVGSLRTRFVGTPLSGRVRAKTGSITGVNTLSGYIERPDGKVLTFSVQANHHALPSRQILAAIDSVVVEMGRK